MICSAYAFYKVCSKQSYLKSRIITVHSLGLGLHFVQLPEECAEVAQLKGIQLRCCDLRIHNEF